MLFGKKNNIKKYKNEKMKIFTVYQSQYTIKVVTTVNLVCVLLSVYQAICKQIQK